MAAGAVLFSFPPKFFKKSLTPEIRCGTLLILRLILNCT